jgi:iron complex outermembrane receptor protein
MRYRPVVVIIFFVLLSFTSNAQQETIELGTITVTSSLLVQQQKETGRNITVIRGDHFRQLPVHAVDELLRYLPGIEIQQRGPQGSQSDINIRGGTFQQVLVIIDGVKLNDPLTGHFNSYIPLHPDEIERVEILKGAASAIYGSEAVGGVINIITKTFAAAKTVAPHSFKAGISAGEFGLLNGNANYHYSGKKTLLSAGFTTTNGDGQPLRGTTGFFNLGTGGISFSQAFNKDWRLSIRAAGDFRKFNAQNYYTTFASDTAEEEVNSWWTQLNLVKKTKKGQLTADAAYKKLRDQYWFRPGTAPNDNKTNLFISQVYYTTNISNKFSITGGIQAQRKEITSNDRGDHHLWHGAAYTIFRQQLADHFYLNESVRLDWDESYGLVLVPQLNAAWSPSRWTFRAAAGRSIRDADFTERYNNYNKALVTSGRIGNPDLNAEESWNFEAGADYYVTSAFKLSGTLFYRNHTDLIDWAPTPYAAMPRKINLSPAGSYALAKNVESVKTKGFELDAVYNKKINERSSILFTAGYTFLNSENKDSIPSFYISTHARHLLNFSMIYRVHHFLVSFTGIGKERNEQSASAIKASITPSYFVMNGKIGYQLPKKYGRLFIQVDNIFDKNYSDLLGSIMPGRWFSAGFDIVL